MKQNEYTLACARRLTREGYGEVEIRSDEAVTATDPEGCRICFRCVPTGWSRVGEIEVEELIQLMRYYGADCGTILTDGRFTLGAKLRAKQEGNITLIARFDVRPDRQEDYDALL
jgi:hypothetical protein